MQVEASRDGAPGSEARWRRAEEEALLRLAGLVPLRRASRDAHVRPATLSRHIREGECLGHGVGGRWFVNGQAVQRWAARHARHASPAGGRAVGSLRVIDGEQRGRQDEGPAAEREQHRRGPEAVALPGGQPGVEEGDEAGEDEDEDHGR